MNWRKAPWGSIGILGVVLLLYSWNGFDPGAALFAGGVLWVMLGLPTDAWIRTGRLSTAATWALFPWFTGWLTGYALRHLADPGSLWYVPAAAWLPAPLRQSAGFPGFAAGLVACIFIERIENRTGKTPTLLPLQVFGGFFVLWLASAVVADKLHLARSWSEGRHLFPVGAACLAWLAVRVARTILNSNATRRAIEERKQSG